MYLKKEMNLIIFIRLHLRTIMYTFRAQQVFVEQEWFLANTERICPAYQVFGEQS